MRTYAQDAGIDPAGQTIDRDKGEGPARCCNVARIAADSLVWYGPDELTASILDRVRTKHKQVPAEGMYLCGGCRETLRRERIVAREEMPTAWPLRLPRVL